MGCVCAILKKHQFHGSLLADEILNELKNLILRKFKWGKSLLDTVCFNPDDKKINDMLISIISGYTKNNDIKVLTVSGFEHDYISKQMAAYILHELVHSYVDSIVPEFNPIPISVNEIFVDREIGEYYSLPSRVEIHEDFVDKFLKDKYGNKIENINESIIRDNLTIKINTIIFNTINHIIETESYLKYDYFMKMYKEKNEEYEKKKQNNLKQIMV